MRRVHKPEGGFDEAQDNGSWVPWEKLRQSAFNFALFQITIVALISSSNFPTVFRVFHPPYRLPELRH